MWVQAFPSIVCLKALTCTVGHMEGTPQIALLLLVLGLLPWAWPRPLTNASIEQVRRWMPVVGWTWAMCSRFIGAANPSAWPHFAARLGSDATALERLAAIVSGDGLVLIGMAIPLWWAVLRRDEDAAWSRAEVVLPLALIAMLGLEGGVEVAASAPLVPTVEASLKDGLLLMFVVLLGASWIGWQPSLSVPLAALGGLIALAAFLPMLLVDPAAQAERGPGLLAASAALALSPRPFPRPSMAAPQGLGAWLSLSLLCSVVLLALLLPRFGGYGGWAVTGTVVRIVTVVAVAGIVALFSLRLGLDAQSQATWTMGRRAWSISPLLLTVIMPAVTLVAFAMSAGAWLAWALLRWWPKGSKTGV
jgi:hypothetical protein